MMKCPSLSMIRRRCPRRPGISLICSQLNGMPNFFDRCTAWRLAAPKISGKDQAVTGRSKPMLPLWCNVDPSVGALSP
jgi:hypothetical protein